MKEEQDQSNNYESGRSRASNNKPARTQSKELVGGCTIERAF
jgi:hypothetical protein